MGLYIMLELAVIYKMLLGQNLANYNTSGRQSKKALTNVQTTLTLGMTHPG